MVLIWIFGYFIDINVMKFKMPRWWDWKIEIGSMWTDVNIRLRARAFSDRAIWLSWFLVHVVRRMHLTWWLSEGWEWFKIKHNPYGKCKASSGCTEACGKGVPSAGRKMKGRWGQIFRCRTLCIKLSWLSLGCWYRCEPTRCTFDSWAHHARSTSPRIFGPADCRGNQWPSSRYTKDINRRSQ